MAAHNNDLVISHYTLRKAIGWLGMLLPFILLTGNFCINKLDILNNSFFINTSCCDPYTADGSFKSSISHYYYSTVGELFTGILITVALFMFCYKGHKLRKGELPLSDLLLTNLAGIGALGVVVFPTGAKECINDNVRTFISTDLTGNIHFAFAGLFFICLAVMAMVNFRRTQEKSSFGKNPEHKLFLFCGAGMLACLGLIFIYSTWIEGTWQGLDKWHPVFCLEALALVFFGISWLRKGRMDLLYIPKKLNMVNKNKGS